MCGLSGLESSCSIRGKGMWLESSCGMRRDENWKLAIPECGMLLSIEVLCRVIIFDGRGLWGWDIASPSEVHIRSLSILPGREIQVVPVQHPDAYSEGCALRYRGTLLSRSLWQCISTEGQHG